MSKFLKGSIVAGIILLVLGVGGLAVAPKNVDYYYISHGSDGSNKASACVYAHWTWHTDEVAYCTDDVDKALAFVTKANSIATGGKH